MLAIYSDRVLHYRIIACFIPQSNSYTNARNYYVCIYFCGRQNLMFANCVVQSKSAEFCAHNTYSCCISKPRSVGSKSSLYYLMVFQGVITLY